MVNISLVSVLFGGDLFVVFPKIIKWFMKKSCQTFVDKRGNSLFFFVVLSFLTLKIVLTVCFF